MYVYEQFWTNVQNLIWDNKINARNYFGHKNVAIILDAMQNKNVAIILNEFSIIFILYEFSCYYFIKIPVQNIITHPPK